MIEVRSLALTSLLISYLLFDYQSIKICSMDCTSPHIHSLCLLFLVLIFQFDFLLQEPEQPFLSGQICVNIINIKNADMVRSVREANSSGKDILDAQKDKSPDRRQDICLKQYYGNSILSGRENQSSQGGKNNTLYQLRSC